MKNYLKSSFVAATALMCVVGMGTKADAALLIDFDNIVFDGGTVTQSGGNWVGTNVIFDSVFLKDTTLVDPIAGVQCGATSAGTAAASPAETCKLNFNLSSARVDFISMQNSVAAKVVMKLLMIGNIITVG